jgi:hypothetical protein
MGVRLVLVGSVSAILVAEGGFAYAQDKGSYTTELPPVEVSPPKTVAAPGRRREAARVVRRQSGLW